MLYTLKSDVSKQIFIFFYRKPIILTILMTKINRVRFVFH